MFRGVLKLFASKSNRLFLQCNHISEQFCSPQTFHVFSAPNPNTDVAHAQRLMSQKTAGAAAKRNKRPGTGKTPAARASKVARTSTGSGNDNAMELNANNIEAGVDDGVEVLPAPVQSESDKKSYRIIKLPNGLQALLVSDPSPIEAKTDAKAATAEDDESDDDDSASDDSGSDDDEDDDDADDAADDDDKEKLAACSLCIDVGSFSDPRDIQGLAHFLEHMIFMGSAKYPAENEFDQYIKKCGGSDNAHTSCEETQFYFEAGEEHLDGAMDRFASLFREPLMHKEAMQREREAVESEYTSKRHENSVRREQLLASFGRPQHPSSIFTWGSMKTLRDDVAGGDDALYERVHEFRRRHYSAHRMFVCVQARMPLDRLQALIVRYWSDMPNNGLAGEDFAAVSVDGHRSVFREEFSTRMVLVKPVANVSRLELTFCLPSTLAKYRTKPDHFLSYLIGHEGEGTLCAYLRKRLYALDLVAGVEEAGFENNSLYTLFTISVHLTTLGLANLRHVHAAVLAYIRFLQAAGPQETLFREIQTINATSFRFRNDQPAIDNVEEFGMNLKYYPPELVFTADHLYLDYNPEHIADILNLLNDPSTPLNVMLTTRTLPDVVQHPFDQTEPWFGTEYALIDFPEGWAELRSNPGTFDEFALPLPNPYVSTDFTILHTAGGCEAVPEHPQRLLDTSVVELWHRMDDRFKLPIAYMYFYMQSPVFRGTAKNCVLASLLPMLLKFRVIERLYPAVIAGLSYDCYTSDKGLVLRIYGYNHQLHRIVEEFGHALRTFTDDLTEEKFRTFVEQKLRDYYNEIIKPKAFAKQLRLTIMEHKFVPPIEKFERLKTVTLTEFRQFVDGMLNELRIQTLMQGNLSASHATDIVQRFVDTLQCRPLVDRSVLDMRTARLPEGCVRYARVRNMNEKDANTVTVNYYQLGPISIRLNCMLDLLLLVAEEPCFDVLRSKEQLGYDVGCTLRDNFGVLGYSVTIVSQETRHAAEHCDRRIEAFRSGWLTEHVANMTDEVFGQFRETLVRLKLTDDNDLRDEMQRNWAEVTTEEYMFDRQRREVECLRSIGRAEFVQFVEKVFDAKRTRKLSVQVIGNGSATPASGEDAGESEESGGEQSIFEMQFKPLDVVQFADGTPEGAELIDDAEKFRAGLEMYPVCKTVE